MKDQMIRSMVSYTVNNSLLFPYQHPTKIPIGDKWIHVETSSVVKDLKEKMFGALDCARKNQAKFLKNPHLLP